jgi:hypothetical protein
MIKELQKILTQVHEYDEYRMVPHDMNHPFYWIWKIQNAKMKDLNLNLRPFRKDHARFDIFINGQFILEKDYIAEQSGKDFHVKFIKANFAGAYNLGVDDDIKIEGDIDFT